MTLPATTEGKIPFRDGHTWYRITGDLASGRAPVVVLHGGPGGTHDYLLTMARLAERGRPVVHYDQFGAGRSSHRPDAPADFWSVDLFVDEVNTVVRALGIGDHHVVGQSWGGMLGAEYAVTRPAGLRSLVIADSPASMDLWVAEANRLRAELPPEVEATLRKHEEAGTTDDPEYTEAVEVFYARHVCRVVPNPPEVQATWAAIEEDPTVYHTMNGPSEFHVIGSIKDWSIVDRVGAISVPTLVVSGAYDEATPATVQPFVDGIPDVRRHVFPESSHMPHVEEEDDWLRVVGDFLDAVDASAPGEPQ